MIISFLPKKHTFIKLLRSIKCFTALLFLVALQGFSQQISLLSVDEGLPQSFVSGIVEDNDGFIWVSTRNGLARYDGHFFKVFQHRPYDKESLTSNFISHIQKDDNNNLWLRYETGELDVFDMQTEKTCHIITSAFLKKHRTTIPGRNWLPTADSTLWYVGKKNSVRSFSYQNTSKLTETGTYNFKNEKIYSLLEDKVKNLWVLSQNSLNKFNAKTNQFQKIPIPYTQSIYNSETPSLHERKNGELMWVDMHYLYLFEPQKTAFRKISLPQKPTYNIKWIHTGSDGKEYFEINKSIYSYDDVSGIVLQAEMNIGSNRETQAFLVDRSGLIWVSPNTDGIYKIDLATDFNSFTYKEDFLIDLLKNEFNITVDDFFDIEETRKSPLAPAYYLRSASHNDKLWIALNRNLVCYDFKREKILKIPKLPTPESEEEFIPINGISITEEGIPLVIDQYNNIYLYETSAAKWELFSATKLLKESPYKNSTPNNIFIDKNTLWITTESNGLIYIDFLNNKLKNINTDAGLPTNNLLELSPDSTNPNTLWIGSSQGLIRLNKKTLTLDVFSVKEGLPDNVIYSIYQDKTGYLWLGTNKGLCSFHTTSHKQRTFNKQHGLSGSEFNRFHKLQLPNKKVAFGGINSGVIFDPLFIKEDKFNPHTAITGIKLNNTDIKKKYKNLLYNVVDSLSLAYNENTINIEYTALQFSHPQDIVYRYRLKGYDNQWVYAGNKREAVYTKIPPGDYLLEINATNTTGEWSDYTKTLALKISPPYWNTWWAWTGYFLIIVAGIWFFVNHRIKQKVIKKEIDLKSKEAKQLRKIDEMKTQFFSNITHELRTPLSLIIGPAEMLKKSKNKEEHNRLLSIISKNADSLLNLTDQLLDIAKLEAGVLKPKMLWGDIITVIKKTINAFDEEAASKKVSIKLNAPQEATYLFSPNTLERIIYNLISNALKFSHSGGNINISLTENTFGISIKIQDDGKGISKKELPNIFKRFYKGTNKKPRPGTGIGLSLVHELVELHQGNISVKSSTKTPTGTTFLISLPFKKAKSQQPQGKDTTKQEEIPKRTEREEKPSLLVVEDNRELANFIVHSLQPLYRIFLAKNGKEGIQLALEKIPDLILSDVLMNGMNGFELCKTLKENINTNHIPTILLTAKSDTESKLEGLSLGADDYITKPFNVSELVMRIDNRLALQKRQREFLYKQLKIVPTKKDTEQKEPIQNEFLSKVHQLIDNAIANENFGVEELAATLNMSRTSLHRKIKSLTNLSTGEIIRTHRLRKAVQLLQQENITIGEVAYKTGFGSPSYFTKCFKETYQLTPTEYIQKITS